MEAISSLQADFDAEIRRRNAIIRNLGAQNDALTTEISEKQKQLDYLGKQVDEKHAELDSIDETLNAKKGEFQKNVDAVQSSLDSKESALTQQKSAQADKEAKQSAKDLELTGKFNNIQAMKEQSIKSLNDMLSTISEEIKEAIKDIESI